MKSASEAIHPTLEYLSTSAKKKKLLKDWMSRPLGKNRFVVWRDVKAIGYKSELRKLVKFKINGEKMDAWYKMFALNEDIYRELVIEFMLTYKFNPCVSNVTDKRFVSFNYRGEKQHVSLAELAVYLGFYSEEQTHSQLFFDSARSISCNEDHGLIWDNLTGTSFHSNVKASAFLKVEHRLLHKLLAVSLHGKKETGGAVGSDDLFVINAMMKKRNVNVAFLVAERIQKETTFEMTKYIYMGAFITRICSRMGLLTEDHMSEYTSSPYVRSLPFDLEYFRTIWLISTDSSGQAFWRATKQLIPGCVLKRKGKRDRDAEDDEPIEIPDEDRDVRAPQDDARVADSTPRVQSVVDWTTPVTPLSQYWTFHALQVRHAHDINVARKFGLPIPEPLMYRCATPPATFPPVITTLTPFTTTVPPYTIPTTSHFEPVYSIHTSAAPSTSRQPPPVAHVYSPTHEPPRPDEPQCYQPVMTTSGADGITLSGFSGMINFDPIPDSELPNVDEIRRGFQVLLEETHMTQQCLQEWGFDSTEDLPIHVMQAILRQHRVIVSESVSGKAASGEHSAAGTSAVDPRVTDQGSPRP